MARSRVIDPEAITACMGLIVGMEEDILDLVASEKVDRALMHAEMDTQKAEDSLKRDADKLTSNWFQTKDEAKAKRQLAKHGDKEGGLDLAKESKGMGTDRSKGKEGDQKRKGKRGVEGGDNSSRKKQRLNSGGGEDNDDEPRDRGQIARLAKRSYKAAKRRGDVDEHAEHLKAKKSAKKRAAGPKLTNFEKKMKKLETEKVQTGKKRSKNQFKSSKRYKRR